MTELANTVECPPHHWEVTSVRINGMVHYHHKCIRCAAEKDVPLSTSSPSKWTSRSNKAKKSS